MSSTSLWGRLFLHPNWWESGFSDPTSSTRHSPPAIWEHSGLVSISHLEKPEVWTRGWLASLMAEQRQSDNFGKRKKKHEGLHIGYTRVSCVQRSPCQSFQILPERAVWRGKYNSAESSCRYTEMLKGKGRTKWPPGRERHRCPSQGNRCPAIVEGLGKKQISKETTNISPVRNSKSLNTCHVWRIPMKITTTGWAQ